MTFLGCQMSIQTISNRTSVLSFYSLAFAYPQDIIKFRVHNLPFFFRQMYGESISLKMNHIFCFEIFSFCFFFFGIDAPTSSHLISANCGKVRSLGNICEKCAKNQSVSEMVYQSRAARLGIYYILYKSLQQFVRHQIKHQRSGWILCGTDSSYHLRFGWQCERYRRIIVIINVSHFCCSFAVLFLLSRINSVVPKQFEWML